MVTDLIPKKFCYSEIATFDRINNELPADESKRVLE